MAALDALNEDYPYYWDPRASDLTLASHEGGSGADREGLIVHQEKQILLLKSQVEQGQVTAEELRVKNEAMLRKLAKDLSDIQAMVDTKCTEAATVTDRIAKISAAFEADKLKYAAEIEALQAQLEQVQRERDALASGDAV
jgi:cytochrome c556